MTLSLGNYNLTAPIETQYTNPNPQATYSTDQTDNYTDYKAVFNAKANGGPYMALDVEEYSDPTPDTQSSLITKLHVLEGTSGMQDVATEVNNTPLK